MAMSHTAKLQKPAGCVFDLSGRSGRYCRRPPVLPKSRDYRQSWSRSPRTTRLRSAGIVNTAKALEAAGSHDAYAEGAISGMHKNLGIPNPAPTHR